MNTTDIHLSLENAAVGYNGRALIRGIEIGVRRGEIVTLVGPNGSGKSTILKSITRQLALVGGNVLLEDREIRQYSQKALAQRMAVVLTGRLQTELMTCRDVAAMGRYPYTGRLGILSEQDEEKVEAALSAVHAQHLSERPFDAVSDGERQRILLARAICQEPEIIVLDEPTSYLDIRHKLELLAILHNMARNRGITVVMSLHEIDLAMKISDRVICVRGEEIFACGVPEEVLDDSAIRKLYDLDSRSGSFDALTGSIELPAPDTGEASAALLRGGSADESADMSGQGDRSSISARSPHGDSAGGHGTGSPDVFVLSSGGTGIPVYRRLQREGTPFIAGILYKNDIDWRAARMLAAEVIEEEPFEEICDRAFTRAMECVRSCGRVVDAGLTVGSTNRRMQMILEEAAALGKLQTVKKER